MRQENDLQLAQLAFRPRLFERRMGHYVLGSKENTKCPPNFDAGKSFVILHDSPGFSVIWPCIDEFDVSVSEEVSEEVEAGSEP